MRRQVSRVDSGAGEAGQTPGVPYSRRVMASGMKRIWMALGASLAAALGILAQQTGGDIPAKFNPPLAGYDYVSARS